MTNNTITIKPKNIQSILFFDDSFKQITNHHEQNIQADNESNYSYLVSINNIKSITYNKDNYVMIVKSSDFNYDVTLTSENIKSAFVKNENDKYETDMLQLTILHKITAVLPYCDETNDKYDELKQNLDDDDDYLDDDDFKHCALKSEHISRFENEFTIDDDDDIIHVCSLNVYDTHNNKYSIINDEYDTSMITDFDD